MKKITKKFIAISLLLILCVGALTACGEGVGDIEPYQQPGNQITGGTDNIDNVDTTEVYSDDTSADVDVADESAEAFELYQQMMENMANVESLDMDMVSTINMDMTEFLGMTVTIVTTGNIRQVMRSETDVDMAMDLTTTMMGDTTSMKMYFRDGVFYTEMEMFGEVIRYSMPMPLEELIDSGAAGGMDDLIDFDEDAIRDFSVSTENGSTIIEFTLDGNAINDLMDQVMAQLESLAMYEDDMSIVIGDVSVEVAIDANGMMQSYRMIADMDITLEGESFSMSMDTEITVNSYNDVTIAFPDDLEEWEDISAWMF